MDGQQACASAPLNVNPPAAPAGAPGQTLLSFGQQLMTEAFSDLNAIGDTAGAQSLQTAAQAQITMLQNMINSALNGNPQSFKYTDLNGQQQTAVFDKNAITSVESLLAAYQNSGAATADGSIQPLSIKPHTSPDAVSAGSCDLDGELNVENYKTVYEKNVKAWKKAKQAFTMGAIIPTIAACAAGATAAAIGTIGVGVVPACLVSAGAVWNLLQAVLLPAKVLLLAITYKAKAEIESQPAFLSSISVVPPSIVVQPNSTTPFSIIGQFTSVAAPSSYELLAEQVAKEIVGEGLEVFESTTLAGALTALTSKLVASLSDEYVQGILKQVIPTLPGTTQASIEVGQASIAPGQLSTPGAQVTVACGATLGSVTGTSIPIQGIEEIDFRATNGNILYLDAAGMPEDNIGNELPTAPLTLSSAPLPFSGTWVGAETEHLPFGQPNRYPIIFSFAQSTGEMVSVTSHVPGFNGLTGYSGTVAGNVATVYNPTDYYCSPTPCQYEYRSDFTVSGNTMTGETVYIVPPSMYNKMSGEVAQSFALTRVSP